MWVIFLETDNFMTLAGLLIFALCHARLVNLFAILLFFSASLLATHLGEELSYFFWKEPGPGVDSKIYFDLLFTRGGHTNLRKKIYFFFAPIRKAPEYI